MSKGTPFIRIEEEKYGELIHLTIPVRPPTLVGNHILTLSCKPVFFKNRLMFQYSKTMIQVKHCGKQIIEGRCLESKTQYFTWGNGRYWQFQSCKKFHYHLVDESDIISLRLTFSSYYFFIPLFLCPWLASSTEDWWSSPHYSLSTRCYMAGTLQHQFTLTGQNFHFVCTDL